MPRDSDNMFNKINLPCYMFPIVKTDFVLVDIPKVKLRKFSGRNNSCRNGATFAEFSVFLNFFMISDQGFEHL